MSIGVGIFLVALGAIIAFGIRDSSGAVNLTVVGVVIMLAGAAGIWLSYHLTNRKARVRNNAIDPAVEEEYRIVEDELSGQRPATQAPPNRPVSGTQVPPTRPVSGSQVPPERPVSSTQVPPEQSAGQAQVPPTGPVAETDQARTVDLDPQASGLPQQPVRRTRP